MHQSARAGHRKSEAMLSMSSARARACNEYSLQTPIQERAQMAESKGECASFRKAGRKDLNRSMHLLLPGRRVVLAVPRIVRDERPKVQDGADLKDEWETRVVRRRRRGGAVLLFPCTA